MTLHNTHTHPDISLKNVKNKPTPTQDNSTTTMSSNTFTTSSFSYSTSSSSSSNGEQTTGHRSTHQSNTDPVHGTTVQSTSQNLGEPAVQETRHYDPQGRELLEGAGSGGGAAASRRIEDVTDAQAERDAQYEERMEDEYAKREGGA